MAFLASPRAASTGTECLIDGLLHQHEVVEACLAQAQCEARDQGVDQGLLDGKLEKILSSPEAA